VIGYAVTVIVPVYNEVLFIDEVLGKLASIAEGWQVVVVDDGSTDGTSDRLAPWSSRDGWILVKHPRNQGKGAAVRTGLDYAEGKVTIVQDADLEYDPADIPYVVGPVLRGEVGACFGSRYMDALPSRPWSRFRLAVVCLNVLSRVLYRQRLTDQATCYKAFPTAVWRSLRLSAERFELCAEITAKLGRFGVPIRDVPVSYRPRTYTEGKKIGWKDGVSAVRTLIAVRFSRNPIYGDFIHCA
jgi:dolichol-phosphate mannosyltransferase